MELSISSLICLCTDASTTKLLCTSPVWMTSHPPSVLWHCWLGHQTCKNRRPYNLYCDGAEVKPCSINQSINQPTTAHQSLTLFSTTIYVLPAVTQSPSHVIGSEPTAVTLFSFAGLTVWNSLPKDMRNPDFAADNHWRHSYFSSNCGFSALEVGYENASHLKDLLHCIAP